ncbi:MAG: hypothetical protein ACLURV_10765 [Gallintestinimicrobium sp.]
MFGLEQEITLKMEEFIIKNGQAEAGSVSRHARRPAAGGSDSRRVWMEKSCMVFFQMRWIPEYSVVVMEILPRLPNLIFVPEYLFEKGKIKEHQIALTSRVEKLARQAQDFGVGKRKYVHDFICENVRYDKLKKPYSHEIIGPLGQA